MIKDNVRKTEVDVDKTDADRKHTRGTTGNIDNKGNRDNLDTRNRGTDDLRDSDRRDRNTDRKI